MKKSIRYLSCLLAMMLLVLSLSSCVLFGRMARASGASEEVSTEASQSVEPPAGKSAFGKEYTLSDGDEEAFLASLQMCLDLMESNASEAEIDACVENMEDLFYHIATQADLAYVLYCMEQDSEEASENYLYSSEMQNDAYYSYMQMCQQVDASSYPYRDRFFADWSENDFLQMRLYTDEVSAINKKNDEILVEYRALNPNAESFADEVCRLYLGTVQNNQALAEMFGFSDYASYAYEVVYERDYSREEMTAMREYVQTYLVPLCEKAYETFFTAYEALGILEQYQLSGLIYNDYDQVTSKPVESYFASLPADMRVGMEQALSTDRAVFTDSPDAYGGAFTGYFYDDSYPICYFGPGYQSSFTVVHEAGHFYAALCEEGLDIDLDLAEVHSQGNEFLMLAYLKNSVSEKIYVALRAYMLYENLVNIIISTLVDEFEEVIYTHAGELDGSAEQMDGMMTEICSRYGGEEFLKEYATDISAYWKFVVIESPVYYISYAVSGISAMTLYSVAMEDYSKALEIYRGLTKELETPEAFLGSLEQAGLTTPFEKEAYLAISALFK